MPLLGLQVSQSSTDPRSTNGARQTLKIYRVDLGSVLAVRVFGSLSIYFAPQPENVPTTIVVFLI